MKRHRVLAGGVAATACGLAFAAAAIGAPKVVHVGNLIFYDNGGISPTKLPKHGSAPVSARIEGEIRTADGSHPPALSHVHAEIERTIEVDAVGLPVCRLSQITATSTAAAKRACPDAIVGTGSAEVEVAFPEQAPFSSTGPLVLFNGGVHGRTTKVFLHAYVNVPAPTAIIVPAEVTRIDDGTFGLELDAKIPRIAGGAGSPVKYDIHIGRTYTYKGKKKSFITASCPAGVYRTKGQVQFSDGTEMAVSHIFPCTGTN